MVQLTVEAIKDDICNDFELAFAADGRAICIHKMQTFCNLPHRYLCELENWKSRQVPHVSKSQIDSFIQCPYKYKLEYLDGWRPPKRPGYFWLGGQFHSAVQRIVRGQKWAVESLPYDTTATMRDRVCLEEILKYLAQYPALIPSGEAPEKPFDFMLMDDVHVIGRADDYGVATHPNGKRMEIIIEYKYAVSEYGLLDVSRGASFYLKGFPDATHFMVVVCKKLAVDPKGKKQEHELRIACQEKIADMGVDGLLKTSIFSRKEFPIEYELESARQVVRTIREWGAKKNCVWPSNYWACGRCQNIFHCKDRGLTTASVEE